MWSEASDRPGQGDSAASRSPGRPTYAEVDLDTIAHNLQCVRRRVGPVQVYGVVKADAYGHGLVRVAAQLVECRVDGICVALAEEGFRLREAGIDGPILVLNGAYGARHADMLRLGLTPVVHDAGHVRAFAAASHDMPEGSVAIHLKIDTGMSRLGVQPGELAAFLDLIDEAPTLRIEGVMTHLSSADMGPDVTSEQLRAFEGALALIRARGHRPTMVHVANSAGTYADTATHYDMVRVGIALYGVEPMRGADSELHPSMRVTSEVIAVRSLAVGDSVGYGQAWTAARPSRVATVPIGYGDGLLRAASNRGSMLVRGARCPIVGSVSMDLTSLDVTDVEGVEVGDDVVVLGAQGDARIGAEEIAEACDTIAYEVLTNLSARVPRRYRGGLPD